LVNKHSIISKRLYRLNKILIYTTFREVEIDMLTSEIILIAIVASIVISLICQYLVTTNKIKVSKISKIFYTDDESFIKSWGKTQERGLIKYIIINIISYTVIMGILGIVIILCQRNGYGYELRQQQLLDYLLMGVVLGAYNSLGWVKNKNRYNRLKEEDKVKSDNIKNDTIKYKA